MDVLSAHAIFDPATDACKSSNNNSCKEVEATLIPFSPCLDPRQTRDIPAVCPTRLRIYSDSDATIFLSELKHLQHMGLSVKNLVSSKKKQMHAVGGSLWCVKVGCLSNS